jgi:hypothetical protein
VAAALFNALLLAHEASDLEVFQRIGTQSDPDSQRFIVLGRFDHLVLRSAIEAEVPTSSLWEVGNARSAVSSSYAGHMLEPVAFNPAEFAATHPILGFCSLRLARRALKEARGFGFVADFLKDQFPADGNIRWALASTTGWEDVVVMFFGRSFNDIKAAVGAMRGLHAKHPCLVIDLDTKDGLHHLILTSCTLPAIACRWHRGWTEADTQQLLTHVHGDEPIRWAIRVEVYPGHWDACASLLKQRCAEKGLVVDISPLFGQADLRLSPLDAAACTHRGLLTLLTEVVFPLEIMPKTVIRTVETRLIPDLDYAEDTGAGHLSTREIHPLSPDVGSMFRSESRDALRHMGAPPHTLHALEETMARIQGMARDRLHGEEFQALHRLATTFNKAALEVRKRITPSDTIYEDEARDLLQDISDWQLYLDRCLADRFRGPYPAGDNMMVRIGSHSGTHLRFLVVMDHFAQKACDLARTRINEKLGVAAMPKVALATFIGNSPTAYATSHTIKRLHCGFTDLPATLAGRIQDCHLVAHETGHHIIRAFFSVYTDFEPFSYRRTGLSHQAVNKLDVAGCTTKEITFLKERVFCDPRILRELRELLADLFVSYLCFPGSPQRHDQAAAFTVGAFYEFDDRSVFMRSVLSEFRLRHLALAALLEGSGEILEDYDERAKSFFKTLATQSAIPLTDSKFTRLQQCRDRLSDALRALLLLSRTREIRAFLDGMASCAIAQDFIGESGVESVLCEFRGFLSNAGPHASASQNFTFLDRLWFMVLRRQDLLS